MLFKLNFNFLMQFFFNDNFKIYKYKLELNVCFIYSARNSNVYLLILITLIKIYDNLFLISFEFV